MGIRHSVILSSMAVSQGDATEGAVRTGPGRIHAIRVPNLTPPTAESRIAEPGSRLQARQASASRLAVYAHRCRDRGSCASCGNRLSVVLPDPADTGFSVRCDCLARNEPARVARAGDGTWRQGCQRPYGRLIRARISAGMPCSSVRAAARVNGRPLITSRTRPESRRHCCASSWPAAGHLDPAQLERFPCAFRAVQPDLRTPVIAARGIRHDLRQSSSRRQPVRCRSGASPLAMNAVTPGVR